MADIVGQLDISPSFPTQAEAIEFVRSLATKEKVMLCSVRGEWFVLCGRDAVGVADRIAGRVQSGYFMSALK